MRAERVLVRCAGAGVPSSCFSETTLSAGAFHLISTKKELESEGEWYWGMLGGPARAGLIFGAKGMEVAHGGAPHDATPIGLGDPPAA